MYSRNIIVISVFITLYNFVDASFCDKLEKQHNSKMPHFVSIEGDKKIINLYWSNNETRAAAELFAVLLRHIIGYENVHVHHTPSHGLLKPNEVMLGFDDDLQEPSDLLSNSTNKTEVICSHPIGVGQQKLYAYLHQDFENRSECINAEEWDFYGNVTALTQCGFLKITSRNADMIHVYEISNNTSIIEVLRVHTTVHKLNLNVIFINPMDYCVSLWSTMNLSEQSFLFIDDDIWAGYPYIKKVQIPACELEEQFISQRNRSILINFADLRASIEHAPLIHQLARYFKPSAESMNVIIKEAIEKFTGMEEAACKWALNNTITVNDWIAQDFASNDNIYNVLVFLNTHEFMLYSDLLQSLVESLKITASIINKVGLRIYKYMNDSANNFVKDIIDKFIADNGSCAIHDSQRILGVVLGKTKYLSEIIDTVDGVNLPVILYDGAGIAVKSKKSVWLASGTSIHLALAIQRFIVDMKWTRIAVLSESSHLAKSLYEDLRKVSNFGLREYSVQRELSQIDASNLLENIESVNARIILVNTNYQDAVTIILEAERHNMSKGYVWIVRDWHANNLTYNIMPITFSFWNESIFYDDRTDEFIWPGKFSAIADAVSTLVQGFNATFHNYLQARNDVHSEMVLREFERSLTHIKGHLRYKDRALENTVVFIEKWRAENSMPLAKLIVDATTRIVNVKYNNSEYYRYKSVNDGAIATNCIVDDGDLYLAICYDIPLVLSLCVCVIVLCCMGYKIMKRPRYQIVNTYKHPRLILD